MSFGRSAGIPGEAICDKPTPVKGGLINSRFLHLQLGRPFKKVTDCFRYGVLQDPGSTTWHSDLTFQAMPYTTLSRIHAACLAEFYRPTKRKHENGAPIPIFPILFPLSPKQKGS